MIQFSAYYFWGKNCYFESGESSNTFHLFKTALDCFTGEGPLEFSKESRISYDPPEVGIDSILEGSPLGLPSYVRKGDTL